MPLPLRIPGSDRGPIDAAANYVAVGVVVAAKVVAVAPISSWTHIN